MRWASSSPAHWPTPRGGRRIFLGGMAGSIVFTIVFAMSGGFPIFTLAWIGNRLFQSQGWAGLVRVSSRWFSYSTYGSVMAVVSLSFLFGDAGCRWMMSQLLAHGVGWRGVFFLPRQRSGSCCLINLLLLRETPAERGLPAPEVNPRNVYADEEPGAEQHAKNRRDFAPPSHQLRVLAGLSAGLRHHAAARDVQPVDADLFCAVRRPAAERGGQPQRAFPSLRRHLRAAGRVSERQARPQRAQRPGRGRDDGMHGVPGC